MIKKFLKINSEEIEYNRSISLVALFTIIMSTFLGFLYWVLRFGFVNNSILTILKVLSVSYLVILLPNYLNKITRRKRRKDTWLTSIAFYSLASVFLLVILGFLSLALKIKLIYPIALFSFLLLALFLIDYFYNFYKKYDLIYLIFFILFSFWVGAVIWGTKYHSPLFFERIVLGLAHVDTLYYSAISSMIKTYSLPSTGVDGLLLLRHHWGSFWIFAHMSSLLNMGTTLFYSLAYPIIFIPFYFKTILTFILDYRKYRNFSFKFNWLFWLVLFLAYIRFANFATFGNEAYLMAVSLAFILFSTIIKYLQNRQWDSLFLLLVLPFFMLIIGLSKISIAFILGGLYGYLFLRLGWHKNLKVFLSILLSFLVFVFIHVIANNKESNLGIIFFDYKSHIEFWKAFFSLRYFWVWAFIILFFYQNQESLKTSWQNFKRKKYLIIEILLVISFFGALPGLIFKIIGGSYSYFFDFQRWAGLSLALVYLPLFANRPGIGARNFFKQTRKQKTFVLVIVLAAVFLVLPILNSYFIQAKNLVANNIVVRKKIVVPEKEDFRTKDFVIEKVKSEGLVSTVKLTTARAKLSQPALENFKNYKLINILENLGQLDREEKQKTCIYIPKDNWIFWDMDIYHDYSFARPFVATALTGMAMIDGVPETGVLDQYGYLYYQEKKRPDSKPLTDDRLKLIAQEKGFSEIIVIGENQGELFTSRLWAN